jgi:transcriptional regulator with GAF, ATPase, and Fis domain
MHRDRPTDQNDPAKTRTFVSVAEPPSAGQAPPQLVVVHSVDRAHVGQEVALSEDFVIVGREHDGAGLCIDDPRLSRVHARFTFDARAGAYRLGDAQSKNGSFVNGQRVETALLKESDVIRMGDTLLVFKSQGLAHLRAEVLAVAATDLTVLLCGETGTGKEVFARSIHSSSERRGKFIAVNCAGLPRELLSSEFFGHTRQAFSGASQARTGLFQAAQDGTLFLDEIGDLPLEAQAVLLRALQEKAVRPVGAELEIPVNVRVVAATHADLEANVKAGSFRADLYARLAQVVLRVPPLRARKAELLELARAIAQEQGFPLDFSADSAEALLCWNWPLNVRELQSLVRAFNVLAGGNSLLGLAYLSSTHAAIAAQIAQRVPAASSTEASPPSRSSAPNRAELEALLQAHGGKVSAVAEQLSKPRAQIYRWMKAFGLSAQRFRR